MKSIKSILPLNLIKNNQNKGMEEELKNFFNEVYQIHSSIEFDQNTQNQKQSSLKFQFTKMKGRGYKQLYLRRKQTSNLIFVQKLTAQRHSKKVFHTVKYFVSKEFVQKTANSSAILKYCKSYLQKEVMIHLRLKHKLCRINFQIRKIC